MTHVLSDWARAFLRENRVGVVSTLNKDGSPHLTTIWFLLADDGSLVITTPERSQKARNLRRDPRIALCVGEGNRSVSLYGNVTISDDKALVQQEVEQLAARYMRDEGTRQQMVAMLVQRSPVVLRFTPERVTEFSGVG